MGTAEKKILVGEAASKLIDVFLVCKRFLNVVKYMATYDKVQICG